MLLNCKNFFNYLLNNGISFITYETCPHLDGKHTIFGKLVGGLAVLSTLEQQPSVNSGREKHKPLNDISILSVNVVEDPFDKIS
jgi:peptidyl-prolyl cis-trans isomerase-like 2